MTANQDSLTKSQDLIEICISVTGSARKLSKITGYDECTISRFRNGRKSMSKPAFKLFELALANGDLRQENARLKRGMR